MKKNCWSKNLLFSKEGFICFSLIILFACGTNSKKENTKPSVALVALDSGEVLAKMYCGSCHLYPSPDLLDKKTWKDHVLPNMGYRFGIYLDRTRDTLIEKGLGGRIVNEATVFPTTQLISNSHWEKIKQFYIDEASDTLEVVSESEIKKTLSFFKPFVPDFKIANPAVTAITYELDSRLFYVADCSLEDHSTITILNSTFKPVTSLGLPYPVSNLTVKSDTLYILMMGHLIPSDEPAGKLVKALKDQNGQYTGYTLVLKDLKRPVDVAYADIDSDGDDDIIVCEYGNHTGSVSLFVKHGKKEYRKQILNKVSGSIKVVVQDLNKDSYQDIIVLMAQGDEGIDVFYNNGNGQFKKERILRFPAVYGSVSFLLTDMNQDGYQDIVYVNGDNGDVSRVLKPYHGIRIFLNDRHNQFIESYFFPLHGAYKAIADDYDQDGDLDIAAISFFPDFMNHPEQGFVFLEKISTKGTLNFEASTFPESKKGRWITMTEADIDRDGDKDLVLGSFTSMDIPDDSTDVIKMKYASESNPMLILRNTTIQ